MCARSPASSGGEIPSEWFATMVESVQGEQSA